MTDLRDTAADAKRRYRTTPRSCQCPARRFNRRSPCKHMRAMHAAFDRALVDWHGNALTEAETARRMDEERRRGFAFWRHGDVRPMDEGRVA